MYTKKNTRKNYPIRKKNTRNTYTQKKRNTIDILHTYRAQNTNIIIMPIMMMSTHNNTTHNNNNNNNNHASHHLSKTGTFLMFSFPTKIFSLRVACHSSKTLPRETVLPI